MRRVQRDGLWRRMRPQRLHTRWLALLPLLTACSLSSALSPTATPFPPPDLPLIQILSPENNMRIPAGASLALEVLAQDESAGIHQVRLFVDDPVGESQPYAAATVANDEAVPVFTARLIWSGARAKSYLLTAVAYRADGTRSDGASISVHVGDE